VQRIFKCRDIQNAILLWLKLPDHVYVIMRSVDHSNIVVRRAKPLGLAAAVSACADQQSGTDFHRIC